MTNEEAIKKLKEAICYTPYRYGEAFEMAIEALEHQPEWISVKDRLPPDNKYILTYTPNLAVSIITQEYVTYYGEDDDEWNEYWSMRGNVTHWMPLPEPPKEET